MISVVVFRPEHLAALKLQAAQSSAQPLMTAQHGGEIAAAPGRAWTALSDGQPLMCAGMIELWSGRAYAWAYISGAALGQFKVLHRTTLELLASAPWRRVEMAVDVSHTEAKRWAWHLGFEHEGTHRAWTNDGRDVEMWARVTCKQ